MQFNVKFSTTAPGDIADRAEGVEDAIVIAIFNTQFALLCADFGLILDGLETEVVR